MDKVDVKFGEWIEKGFNLYKENFGILVPASVESFNMVKRNFWPFLGFSIVSNLIGSIGAVACGIGVVFTLPIQICILTVAYREIFDHKAIDAMES